MECEDEMSRVLLVLVVLAGWLTAIINDAGAAWGWLAVDILLSPIGVVRGWLMWLGLAG